MKNYAKLPHTGPAAGVNIPSAPGTGEPKGDKAYHAKNSGIPGFTDNTKSGTKFNLPSGAAAAGCKNCGK